MSLRSLYMLVALLAVACGGGSPAPRPTTKAVGSGSGTGTGTPSSGDDDDDSDDQAVKDKTVNWLAGVKAMSDDDAIPYMKKQCGKCHDAKAGGARSFWAMDVNAFSRRALEGDAAYGRVYQTIVQGAKQLVGQRPSPMPQNTGKWTDKQVTELKTLVMWFQKELPGAVQSAATQFGGGAGAGAGSGEGGVGIVLNFTCDKPSTFRQYINRLMQDAFSRNATADELKLGGDDPDSVVSKATRKKMAARVFEDAAWKKEFVDTGLRKFADKLAGASSIAPSEGLITADEATDLQQEFYQKLKREFDAKPFKDILLSTDVMVTAKTAKFYDGCSASGSDWSSCAMKAPRDSFFTTMGYLRSKPSSFLQSNNNYGRAALMHFIVRGDVFRAAFDQNGGSEELEPLPACLVSKDYRVEKTGDKVSPTGAMAIPSYANLCQSCHIERQMAAGSILFRPFHPSGLIYKKNDAQLDISKDKTFKEIFPDNATVSVKVKNRPHGPNNSAEDNVEPKFFQELLDDLASKAEKGCVPAAGDEKEVTLNQVSDLAKYLIGDGRVLAGGLARHIPRAMSNVDNTSEEIVVRFNSAFADGGGKLAPLFEAYFTSETYSCERN